MVKASLVPVEATEVSGLHMSIKKDGLAEDLNLSAKSIGSGPVPPLVHSEPPATNLHRHMQPFKILQHILYLYHSGLPI